MLKILIIFLLISQINGDFISIETFGAVAVNSTDSNTWSPAVCSSNARAIESTALDAYKKSLGVLVPGEKEYCIIAVHIKDITSVPFKIEGTLTLSDNITAWPHHISPNGGFVIQNSRNITLFGGGVFNGQGLKWWWYVYLNNGTDFRPRLLAISDIDGLVIKDLSFFNSPIWTVDLTANNVFIDNVYIKTNIDDTHVPTKMPKNKGFTDRVSKSLMNDEIPTFPLNTDGIDCRCINATIQNSYIETYDDSIAIKPKNGGSCSQNITARNITTKYGIGMTIGSVPPNPSVNCVRNVTFTNIKSKRALKAIYVKSNPGDDGTGLIENILYENFWATESLWYPLWIGPQQQKQPHTPGTGCSFFYPMDPTCPTNPRVTMRNITLQNVQFEWGITLPGVLRCDEANPCSVNFENVTNYGLFAISSDYDVHNVNITTRGIVDPVPKE